MCNASQHSFQVFPTAAEKAMILNGAVHHRGSAGRRPIGKSDTAGVFKDWYVKKGCSNRALLLCTMDNAQTTHSTHYFTTGKAQSPRSLPHL
jgi:hypothetical protein